MKRLLKELRLKRFNSVTICINNQRIISLTKNSEFHVCTKHIDIHYHYIREVESKALIQLNYISTNDMTADRLTKPLSALKFTQFVNLIDLISY